MMKKKIKDLTIQETEKLCDTYKCNDCPAFDKETGSCKITSYIVSLKCAEEEIEVVEDVD